MEALRELSRRQIDALRAVQRNETPERGASLLAVARQLKIRPPSALDHLTVLEERGLIERRRGKSRLTPAGRTCLIDYLRHHRVAERLFQQAGLSADETCQAAREIDLALSHRLVTRIYRAEGSPLSCPHGGPIPRIGGRDRSRDRRA
ncbi:MAG: metal-dependent transcriptional regulator [Thermoplasmata archaeon]